MKMHIPQLFPGRRGGLSEVDGTFRRGRTNAVDVADS